MIKSLICSMGLCLVIPNAQAAISYLYDGRGTPDEQGWTRYSGAGHLGGTSEVSLVPGGGFEAETDGMAFNSYAIDTGYAEFMVSARIRMTHAQYNFADAGLMFSVLGEPNQPDRFSGFFLTPDQVGFMDLTDMAPVTAEQYHDYTVLYRDNALSFFLDDSFDDIMSGVAMPELYRLDPIPSIFGNRSGVVQIGDWTNDLNVNSRYRMQSVSFLGITPIPEPGTSLMLSLGLGFLAFSIQKKRFLST